MTQPTLRRTHTVLLALAALAAMQATTVPTSWAQGPQAQGIDPGMIVRMSADDFECPYGTEPAFDQAPDGSRSARWCQATRGLQVARHGPYLELFSDGTIARQGGYLRGVQAGLWASWTADDAALTGPVRFAWDPPTDDTYGQVEYEYSLTRYSCDPYRAREVLAKARTLDLSVEFDLPRTEPGEVYVWSLLAQRNGKAIGQMMSFGKEGGYGWSLGLRVE